MKMKRVLAGLLAIAMLGSVAGCAKGKNTEQSQASSVESEQTEETREEKISEWEIAYEERRERQKKFLDKKVEYGDEVYLSCYRQAIVGQWTDRGEVTFAVDTDAEQFQPEEYKLLEETVCDRVYDAVGKGVGDSFTIGHEYGDCRVFDKYTILAIEKNKELGNQKDSVEYGDTICAAHKRAERMAEDTVGMEYLGGALLLVGEGVTQFAAGDAECPEAVVTELLQKVQGRDRYSQAIRIYDDRYEYWFAIRTVNWYKEPSYELPKDWGYKFYAPQIGSFQGYSLEHAGTDDMEDGEFFGFPDWLTDGCSDWCGCSEYICEVEATSRLANQGSVNYSPSHLRAESRNSVWAEGVEGNGIGESIFIKQMYAGTGDVEFTISDICIVNGYAQNETKWQENGRVKSLKLFYEDEYMGLIALEDTMNPQFIDVRPVQMKVGNGFDANFRFEIAEVYEGTKYEDTCLTGILIDFEGKSAH